MTAVSSFPLCLQKTDVGIGQTSYINIPESDSENAALNPNSEPWTRLRDGGSLTVHPDGHAYTYSYGPKGLAGLFSNQYTLWCVIFASIGGLSFGYDQGVVCVDVFIVCFRAY